MKKLKPESSKNSPSTVLAELANRWQELQKQRKFNPDDEIFDFRCQRSAGESEKSFARRQESLIREFVEEYLWFRQRGEQERIRLLRIQVKIIADIFYERIDPITGKSIQAAIVWANRGGGKSMVAAIVIFLCMVWKQKSFSDLAGSQEQATEVYNYVANFWECIPIVKDKLLDGEPLMLKTRFKNGVTLKCIANSQNQARGKHPEGFVADETCQKEHFKDENVLAATNSVLTQDEFIILYTSTFHLPTGLFADTWDNAKALDFRRYKWNIYDCMEKCSRNIECENCQLTRKKFIRGVGGKIVKTKYYGCYGRGRKATGWLSFEQVLKIKTKAEIRGHNWRVEFECHRPETYGRVYRTSRVEKSLVNYMRVPNQTERAVGIDFGTSKQCAIVMTILSPNGLLVPWSDFSTAKDLDYILETLRAMKERYGDFLVYGDAEQSYGIMYLRKNGFTVESIPFNKYKTVGIQNLERYFNNKRLQILNNRPNRILWKQLIKYRKDEHGEILKVEDHGPDALMLAALRFDFLYYFKKQMERDVAQDMLKKRADENSAENELEINQKSEVEVF